MVSTEVCRSAQSIFFTNYQKKPFQHAFTALTAEKLLHIYFNDVQLNRRRNFQHFFTEHLPATASEIRTVSFLRMFCFLDKSVLLHCRCLMSKFTEMLILVCRKIFPACQLILHESFSNSYGFALLQEFNPFYPHFNLD